MSVRIKKVRNIPVEWNQVKYTLLAILFYVPASTDYILNFGAEFYPMGFVFVLCSLVVFGYAIIKYRLMDISLAITRAGIIFVVYAFLLGIPFLVGYKMFGSQELWYFPIALGALFALLGPMIYNSVRSKAESILLSEQRRYHKILIQTAEGLAKGRNLAKIIKLVVYLVSKTVKVSFAVIFLHDEKDGKYHLRASRDVRGVVKETVLHEEHPLVSCVSATSDPFLLGEAPDDVKCSLNGDLSYGLVVPLVYNNKQMGFMFLGGKLSGKMYSEDDFNIFKIMSHHIALAIDNCS